jgi:enoyl-CoA hydratase/carnithine racemase
MAQLTYEIRNGIAWVTFDSGGMNTLSQAAVTDARAVVDAIAKAHAATPLAGVVLKGNKFGLGAGANIGELMSADRAALAAYIDVGHELPYAIERGPCRSSPSSAASRSAASTSSRCAARSSRRKRRSASGSG